MSTYIFPNILKYNQISDFLYIYNVAQMVNSLTTNIFILEQATLRVQILLK
jgi:hypothetical protein